MNILGNMTFDENDPFSLDCFTAYLPLKQPSPSPRNHRGGAIWNIWRHPFNFDFKLRGHVSVPAKHASPHHDALSIVQRRSKLAISIHRFFENLASLISRFINAILARESKMNDWRFCQIFVFIRMEERGWNEIRGDRDIKLLMIASFFFWQFLECYKDFKTIELIVYFVLFLMDVLFCNF